MGLSTDYVRLATLVCCLVFINVQGDSPILTLPDQTYYVGQSITVSCRSGVSDPISAVAINIDSNDFKYEFECYNLYGVWNSTRQSAIADNCNTLPPSGEVTVQMTIQLVEKMRSSTVTCTVTYFNLTRKLHVRMISMKTNAFSDAYVAPTRLEFDKFEFDDGVPVLNKKTQAQCNSSGSFPPSEYTYEVRNKSDASVYSITVVKDGFAEFTINDSLKNGFKVTCRDKIHTRGEISLTKSDCGGTGSEWCLPRFLDISQKDSGSQTVAYNPSYSNTLKCEVESHHPNLITYSWTSNGVVIPSATKATYTIPANSSRALVQETVSCTASLDKYGNVTITWNITWSLQATTTTEPPAPGTSSASIAIGVGVGVSSAVVIIGVVVGIILYKKRQDNSLRYQNTAPDPASEAVDKQEKATKKSGLQSNNGGHPPHSKSGDHIIYAELDKDILRNEQPQPVKPNPKCTQEIFHANKLIHNCSLPKSFHIFHPFLEFTLLVFSIINLLEI